jgi:hypothetical protein
VLTFEIVPKAGNAAEVAEGLTRCPLGHHPLPTHRALHSGHAKRARFVAAASRLSRLLPSLCRVHVLACRRVSTYEVGELSFDLRARRPVIILPALVHLLPASSGDRGFVGSDFYGSPACRSGALEPPSTAFTCLSEVGPGAIAGMMADFGGRSGRTCDCCGLEVDQETILGEHPACRSGLFLQRESMLACSRRSWNSPVP